MLGKLIKYEWKSTYKMGGIILLVIAAMTLLGVLGFALPARFITENQETLDDSLLAPLCAMMMMMSMMLYVISLIGAAYAMMIYQGVHFYKTMYTDEGYLTQTLPVTPRQLLFSKTFVAGIWNMIVGVCIGLSVMILIGSFISALVPAEAWQEFGEMWEELQRELQREFARNPDWNVSWTFEMIHFFLSLFLLILVGPFCTMMTMFGALTIGQLSGKYKALIGILAYFGVMIVQSVLMQVVQFVFTFGSLIFSESVSGVYTNTAGAYDSTIIVSLVMGVAMYFVAHHILTKKLNMD